MYMQPNRPFQALKRKQPKALSNSRLSGIGEYNAKAFMPLNLHIQSGDDIPI
jgi:hypothetical protein